MTERILFELGPWAWWVLGLALLAAEMIVPGVFLVWIGIAAIVTGALSLLLWEQAFWTWQIQWLVFAMLSLVAALIGRRIVSARGETSDQPHLNQRSQSHEHTKEDTAFLLPRAARRARKSSGSNMTWVVPSRYGILSV